MSSADHDVAPRPRRSSGSSVSSNISPSICPPNCKMFSSTASSSPSLLPSLPPSFLRVHVCVLCPAHDLPPQVPHFICREGAAEGGEKSQIIVKNKAFMVKTRKS